MSGTDLTDSAPPADLAGPVATEKPPLPARTLSFRHQAILLGGGVGALAAVVLIALMAHAAAPEPTPVAGTPGIFKPSAEQFASLRTMVVGQASHAAQIEATGMITANADHSTPVYANLTGRIVQVMVEPGQRVAKGQALFTIHADEIADGRGALIAATAARESANAQLLAAQQNADRANVIYHQGGGALRDYQQAVSELAAAKATLRSADGELAAAREKLAIAGSSAREIAGMLRQNGSSRITVRAPMAGIIAQRNVAPGQSVVAGGDTPLLTVTDPSRLWLVADVPETAAAHVSPGDSLVFTTPAWPGREFHAKVATVGAGIDPETRRLPVRASLANSDGALRPQMFADIRIETRNSGGARAPAALTVPANAVIREDESATVWVVARDHSLRARSVTIAEGNDPAHVTILSGLRPGERIVTEGAIFVNEAGTAD